MVPKTSDRPPASHYSKQKTKDQKRGIVFENRITAVPIERHAEAGNQETNSNSDKRKTPDSRTGVFLFLIWEWQVLIP